MQIQADAGVCQFEEANLERTVTAVRNSVFFELSHALPCRLAMACNVPKLQHKLGHSSCIFASIHLSYKHSLPIKGILLLLDLPVLSASKRTNSWPRLTFVSLLLLRLCLPRYDTSLAPCFLVLGLCRFFGCLVGFVRWCLALMPGSYLLSVPIYIIQLR